MPSPSLSTLISDKKRTNPGLSPGRSSIAIPFSARPLPSAASGFQFAIRFFSSTRGALPTRLNEEAANHRPQSSRTILPDAKPRMIQSPSGDIRMRLRSSGRIRFQTRSPASLIANRCRSSVAATICFLA